jgi:hypothetical protein
MGAWCLVLCSLVVVSLGPVFQGVGSASTTGRYSIPHPRFSQICNDASCAHRFPRSLGRGKW